MPHYYDSLSDDLKEWALEQKVFFTATAPFKGRHVNVSPKGLVDGTFHIFDPNHAAYLDTAGSGIETISHLYENKRITIMFCSLDKKPRIMRLFCNGTVVERVDPKFPDLFKSMGKGELPLGMRAIIKLEILQVQTSCGYGVPFLDRTSHAEHSKGNPENYKCFKDRPTLNKALNTAAKKGKLDGFIRGNARSIDGLLGLREARKMNGEWLFAHDVGAWMRVQVLQGPAILFGILIGFLLFAYGIPTLAYFIRLSGSVGRLAFPIGAKSLNISLVN